MFLWSGISLEAWSFGLNFSSSLSLKRALRESGCRIGYEPTKTSRDHFWRSISMDTNVEVSALSPFELNENEQLRKVSSAKE